MTSSSTSNNSNNIKMVLLRGKLKKKKSDTKCMETTGTSENKYNKAKLNIHFYHYEGISLFMMLRYRCLVLSLCSGLKISFVAAANLNQVGSQHPSKICARFLLFRSYLPALPARDLCRKGARVQTGAFNINR